MKRLIMLSSCIVLVAICITTFLLYRTKSADVQKTKPDITEEKVATPQLNSNKLTQAQTAGLTPYAKYNSDLDEFYDSRYIEWDTEQQQYVDVLSDVQFDTNQIAYEPDCVLPEALQVAIDEFSAAMKTYYEDSPSFALRSDYYFLDDTDAIRKLENDTSVSFFEIYLTMANCKYPYYRVLGNYMIQRVLHLNGNHQILTANGLTLLADDFSNIDLFIREATETIRKKSETITMEDCIELTKYYGYLIAPALQEIGKLELLPIDSDSPCQDAVQLAELVQSFT